LRELEAAALGVATLLALGDGGVALLFGPSVRGAERAGLAFALGCGLASLVLFGTQLAAPGRAGASCVFGVALAVTGVRLVRARGALERARGRARALSLELRSLEPASIALLIGLAIVFLAGLGNVLTSPLETDGSAIWAHKARAAFVSGGLPRAMLTDPSRAFAHPEYPWLVPLTEAFFFSLAGEASDRLAQVATFGSSVALVAVVYGAARARLPRTGALGAALVLALLPRLDRYTASGNADGTLALFWTASACVFGRWLREGRARDALAASVLVAFAAFSKREGAVVWALEGAVLALSPLLGRTGPQVLRAGAGFLGATLVVLVPWWVISSAAPRAADFEPISLASLRLERLPEIATLALGELGNVAHWGLLFYALAAAVVLGPRRKLVDPWLVASASLPLGALAFGYVFSRWTPWEAHVVTSFDRLVLPQAPLAVLVLADAAARLVLSPDTAEVRNPLDGVAPRR
jgi:4-amino-4-deoxy-L-arabinose transferase-like glycosyltransferase